jgi:hypothetical protein
MLVNEYKPEFQFKKSRPSFVVSRTDGQNGLDFHFINIVNGETEMKNSRKNRQFA